MINKITVVVENGRVVDVLTLNPESVSVDIIDLDTQDSDRELEVRKIYEEVKETQVSIF